jgi:hypothetical protein
MNDICKLIDLTSDILAELNRVNDTIEPEEYEDYYVDNLERAYEMLSEVKDLIYG